MLGPLRQAYRALPLSQRTRAEVRSVLRRVSRILWPWRGPDGLGPLAPREPGRPDYLIFAVIDWHFRIQRPQHLALELAAQGHRVFYLSSELAEHPRPGFRAEPLDGSGRLFQVRLSARGSPSIYFAAPGEALAAQLEAGLRPLLDRLGEGRLVCLVQHPFWVRLAAGVQGAKLVYDCMDFHEGFETFSEDLRRAEDRLLRAADLTVVTSQWLQERVAPLARHLALVRNATDHTHFAAAPTERFRDPEGRAVIGYYGALAQWFDPGLVREVAERFAHCLVLLIGHDQAQVKRALGDLPNVRFLGEVAYPQLPYFLYGFDLCLLPFRILPLTLATNPVKLYEYLSAGKPVVSVDLPEAHACDGLVLVAKDGEDFLRLVAQALESRGDRVAIAARQAFAATQTWQARGRALQAAVDAIPWAGAG